MGKRLILLRNLDVSMTGCAHVSFKFVSAADLIKHASVVGKLEVGWNNVEIDGVVFVIALIALILYILRFTNLAHVILLYLVHVHFDFELVLRIINFTM